MPPKCSDCYVVCVRHYNVYSFLFRYIIQVFVL